MTAQHTREPEDRTYIGEGREPDYADFEPDLPSKTSLVPAFQPDMRRTNPAAETGLMAAVQVSGEGKDDDDEQDATLTGGETASDANVIPEAQENKVPGVQNTQPTILIVEDTTELAEVIQATLEASDMKVFHETHGDRGLARLNELNPDLVLLDISLPDTTGWKIMDALKDRLEQDPENMPKIIIITAYDDPANRLIGKLQGVHDYLIKPFSSDTIEQTVQRVLNS